MGFVGVEFGLSGFSVVTLFILGFIIDWLHKLYCREYTMGFK